MNEKKTLYHYSNHNNLKYLKYEECYPVCFSIHKNTHDHYGNHCYIIEVYARDIPQEYLYTFRNSEGIIESVNKGDFVNEEDLEICFFHDIYNIKQIK